MLRIWKNFLGGPRKVFLGLTLAVSFAFSSSAVAGIPLSGLVGEWLGNGNATDSSVTANSGSFSGVYAPGIEGNAFDLLTGKVSIPDNAAYNLGASFSIGFWFNDNGRGHGTMFLGQDDGGGSVPKWVILYGYTGSHFDLHVNGSTFAFLHSDDVVLPNTGWNQLTVTVGGGAYAFYFDGTPLGGGAFGSALPNPSAALRFGENEGITYNGLMDDVVIYNRTLSAAEANELARRSTSVPEPTGWLTLLTSCFALVVARLFRRKIVRNVNGKPLVAI